MDLHIKITDEDGRELDYINVYQDGSDAEGALNIRRLINNKFPPRKLRREHGTRYGISHSVGEWEQICRSLRKDGEDQYATGIENDIASLQVDKLCNAEDFDTGRCVKLMDHLGECVDDSGVKIEGKPLNSLL